MDEIISWLLRLLDFNTTAGGKDSEACVCFIRQTLTSRGIGVHTYAAEGTPRQAHHLLAVVPGERRESVLLHAHLDTTEYGDRDDWLFPADRGTRRNGCICGRGAIDCKGPLAVWMKLASDAAAGAPRPYTLKLLVSDLEEQGGHSGLGLLLERHPELLSDVKLVIGEGGGFPFPFQNDLFYTFQTGERESVIEGSHSTDKESGWEQISRILSMGAEKGYYNSSLLAYARQADTLSGRRLDIRPLYEGMEPFFQNAPVSNTFGRYGPLFEAALREQIPNARLMPCITPGCSDNRWFRKAAVPVIGFFPLDIKNSLGGIHGNNEYISEASLSLAYRTMSRLLENLSIE